MTADTVLPAKNVYVSFVPPVADSKMVRFRGETFGDLKARLSEAKVPGVGTTSYIELEVPNQGYICLLDDEQLPADTKLSVRVHLDLVVKEPVIVRGQPSDWRCKAPLLMAQTFKKSETVLKDVKRAASPLPDVPPQGVPPGRWAKHIHKMHKMDKKVKERNAKLQEKVHKMYHRLEKHGSWHSPPGSPRHNNGPALGLPGFVPPHGGPHHHPHRHHHHHHHHMGKHRHHPGHAHGCHCHRGMPSPMGGPAELGFPVDAREEAPADLKLSDPSGETEYESVQAPESGVQGSNLAKDLKGMELRE